MSRLTKLVHRLTTPRRRLVPVFAIAIAATAAVAAACGGGGGYGGSSVPSATAPGGAAVAPTSANGGSTPLAGGQPGATPTAATGSSSGSMQLTVVASNTSFDKTSLNATAGEVKFTLNNKDGIAHNLHVFKGNDDTGQSIGMTQIEAGPVQNSFTVNLAPGTYHYQCDVHPTQMHGTLVVK